jgi:colanic acid biosynthesis glycosyl transferase WcaI
MPSGWRCRRHQPIDHGGSIGFTTSLKIALSTVWSRFLNLNWSAYGTFTRYGGMHTGDAVSTNPLSTLLIITQVYPPDPTAVGQHLADVAEALARSGWRVVVYTAARGYDDPEAKYPRRELRNGVDVRRLSFSSFGKSSIFVRLLAAGLFILQATAWGAFRGRVDRILVSTVPPFSNFAGVVLSWIHRAPLTWWVMDLNPDQLVRLGKAKPNSRLVRIFDWLNRLTLRRAAAVVVLDDFIRDRVVAKAQPVGTLEVVPPWSHEQHLTVAPRDSNPFRKQHGLEGTCVVMYSGNHGLTNPLNTLLESADALRDHPTLRFLFVGGGVQKPAIEAFIRDKQLPNAMPLPYQPLAELGNSLSAADVHVVSISPEAVGVSHSCKIYGAMAVGRPVLALAPRESHVGGIMETHACGWSCEHGDVDGLVALLQGIADMDSSERDSIGTRGARAVDEHFKSSTLIDTICRIVKDSR